MTRELTEQERWHRLWLADRKASPVERPLTVEEIEDAYDVDDPKRYSLLEEAS